MEVIPKSADSREVIVVHRTAVRGGTGSVLSLAEVESYILCTHTTVVVDLLWWQVFWFAGSWGGVRLVGVLFSKQVKLLQDVDESKLQAPQYGLRYVLI